MKFNQTKNRTSIAGIIFLFVASSIVTTSAAKIVVSGKCNPWLAGATNGTIADDMDVAPTNSPTEVVGFILVPGSVFTFSASGGVDNNVRGEFAPPEGVLDNLARHRAGAEHGISDITHTPFNSLLGVFLGPGPATDSAPAPPLDFGTQTARDYRVLSPLLAQVFFIGDGQTSDGVTQRVVVPDGATRLFLGTLDTYGWYNNRGSFTVDVSHTQAPLLGIRFAVEPLTDVQLWWSSRADLMYQVEYRLDLEAGRWIPLGLPVLGTGITNLVQDSFLLGSPQRYYRLVVLP